MRWLLFLAVGLARTLFVRAPAGPDPLVSELRDDRRFDSWLLVREALFVVVVVAIVLVRASLA